MASFERGLIYAGLITIVLFTSQAQASFLKCLFCSQKNSVKHEASLLREVAVESSLLKQIPQEQQELKQIPQKQQMLQKSQKSILPELFIAPTAQTLEIVNEIQTQKNYQNLKSCAMQFALEKLEKELKLFNRIEPEEFKPCQLSKVDTLLDQKQPIKQLQLMPKADVLLSGIEMLHEKFVDFESVDQNTVNQLNKVLDELAGIFTTAKEQNYTFSTSDLLSFAKRLNKINDFNDVYDLHKFTALYAAIVQHIKPYYSGKNAEKLILYNDLTKNADEILKIIRANQKEDENYRDHNSLINCLIEQMEACAKYLSDDGSQDLDQEKMEASIACFQILGELASKTDGVWASTVTQEHTINLYKITDVLWKLKDEKTLTNLQYTSALVSALEHVVVAAIPEREYSIEGALFDASELLNLITKTICAIENKEQIQSLLPAMFRAYAHINAKMYISSGVDLEYLQTLELASESILSLINKTNKDQQLAIKEAVHCVVVMTKNIFKKTSLKACNCICSMLQSLIKIDSKTYAIALQSLRVYELATACEQWGVNYNSQVKNIWRVLQTIGEYSNNPVILQDAICMLRRINIFLDELNTCSFTKETTRVLSLISDKYTSLCKNKLRSGLTFVLIGDHWKGDKTTSERESDTWLKRIFGEKEITKEQYLTLLYVSQFLDIQKIDPFYVIDVKDEQYTQFLESIEKNKSKLAKTVLDACFQQQQQQVDSIEGVLSEHYKNQPQKFGAM